MPDRGESPPKAPCREGLATLALCPRPVTGMYILELIVLLDLPVAFAASFRLLKVSSANWGFDARDKIPCFWLGPRGLLGHRLANLCWLCSANQLRLR